MKKNYLKEKSLIKAAIKTYRWEYARAYMIGGVGQLIDVLAPILVQQIIQFLQTGEGNGIFLVACLIITQMFAYICQEHNRFNNMVTGLSVSSALTALIFEKTLRLTSSTMSFGQGQIFNFVQSDTLKILNFA